MKGRAYFQYLRYTPEESEKLLITTRWELCKMRRRALGNMTQEEYAAKCGVSAGVIRRVESQLPYNPSWSSKEYLSILGVSMDFAMDHIVWPTGVSLNVNNRKY